MGPKKRFLRGRSLSSFWSDSCRGDILDHLRPYHSIHRYPLFTYVSICSPKCILIIISSINLENEEKQSEIWHVKALHVCGNSMNEVFPNSKWSITRERTWALVTGIIENIRISRGTFSEVWDDIHVTLDVSFTSVVFSLLSYTSQQLYNRGLETMCLCFTEHSFIESS